MSFTTYTHKAASKELMFIDVGPKPATTDIKEERSSSPDERPNKKSKERLQCSECSHTTCSAEQMQRHMRRHRGENPFQCSWCDYSTYNSTLFQEHVNIHLGIKPYKCNLCDYRSVSKKYIKKHESRHGKCHKCGILTRDIRLLRKHWRRSACGAEDTPTVSAAAAALHDDTEPYKDGGKYTCKSCNLYYDSEDSLKQHIRYHKPCPECGESFSMVALHKHRKKAHGITNVVGGKKKFKCAICEWESNCYQKILLHLIHHPNQKVDSSIDVTPLIKAGIMEKVDEDSSIKTT